LRIDPTTFDSVFFDMDGVLIDSEPVSAEVMQEASRQFGFDVPDHAMASFKGLPGNVVYERVITEFGTGQVDAATLRSIRDTLYEKRLPHIPLFEGTESMLRHLVAQNKRIALVTSSRRRHAETVLAVHDLRSLFSAIVGSEDIDRPKPSPDPYLAAALAVGCRPDRAVAVEDSENGVRSAHAAGCHVIGFGSEFPATALLEAGAETVCQNYRDLFTVMG
jgi:HAD superfamily hydrolase (TIGR01509 family)